MSHVTPPDRFRLGFHLLAVQPSVDVSDEIEEHTARWTQHSVLLPYAFQHDARIETRNVARLTATAEVILSPFTRMSQPTPASLWLE